MPYLEFTDLYDSGREFFENGFAAGRDGEDLFHEHFGGDLQYTADYSSRIDTASSLAGISHLVYSELEEEDIFDRGMRQEVGNLALELESRDDDIAVSATELATIVRPFLKAGKDVYGVEPEEIFTSDPAFMQKEEIRDRTLEYLEELNKTVNRSEKSGSGAVKV